MLIFSNLINAQMYFTLEHTFYPCLLRAYSTAGITVKNRFSMQQAHLCEFDLLQRLENQASYSQVLRCNNERPWSVQ